MDRGMASTLSLESLSSTWVQGDDELVYLVDDDPRIRESVSDHLATLKIEVICFESAAQYLGYAKPDKASCLILDLALPGISGLDLQRQMADETRIPTVFISGNCDVSSSVQAMKAGAIEFLTKPLNAEALLSAIRAGLTLDRKIRQKKADLMNLQRRFSLLTPRERALLPLLVSGLLNKQAATKLDISAVTVQVYRGQIMRKMAAKSFADLIRIAGKLGIEYSPKISEY